MGSITYDGWTIDFDDRLLAHLHLVILQGFRNQKSFAMSWVNAVESGDGRGSIWLHPDGDIAFRFTGSRVPAMNPEWVARLSASIDSSHGLIVTGEDGQLARSHAIKQR